ncbi:MAG: hypothetical protein ACK5LT_06990 [Lachnospirales bacterium]
MIDFLIIGTFVVGIIVLGLYFLNKWASKKMDTQQSFVETSKQTVNIYAIDKSHDRITNVSMPKMVTEQIPFYSKILKMYFVKAKIGPQIMTLMCEKHVYDAITLKKNIRVEIAGIYIVSVIGMKSKEEMKQIKKDKKKKNKEAKKQ